jgi:hypothetical protein
MESILAKEKKYELVEGSVKQYAPNTVTLNVQNAPGDQPLRHAPDFLPITDQPKPMIDVEYEGERTIEGNDVPNAPLDYPNGNLFSDFDLETIRLSFQYDYLKMTSRTANDDYNRIYADESLPMIASLEASAYKDMEFMVYDYETNMPHMTSGDAGKVGYAVWCQSMWQSYASVPAKLNALLKRQDWMIKRCTGLAESQMTLINGQFMRKTLLGVFRGLFAVVRTGYLDLDWFRAVNAITISPYCENDASAAGYCAVMASHIIPNLQVKFTHDGETETLFDYDNDPAFQQITVTLRNGETTVVTTYDFQMLIQHINELLEPAEVIKKARLNATGRDPTTLTYYVNDVIASVNALIGTIERFREVARPLLSTIERLEEVGNVFNWAKGMQFLEPTLPREQEEPVRYMMTKHIMTSLGVAGPMAYDDDNGYLGFYTLWKRWEGVPKYDLYEGGIALATSVRDIHFPEGLLGVEKCYPTMFLRWYDRTSEKYDNHHFINRRGDEFSVDLVTYNAEDVANNPYLRTLQLGSKNIGSIRVPTVTLSKTVSDPLTRGKIQDALMAMFGICNVIYDGADHFSKSPDLIGFDKRNFRYYVKLSQDYCETHSPMTKFTNARTSFFKM